MDDELRQDAVDAAQGDADDLTQRLFEAERAHRAEQASLGVARAAALHAQQGWRSTVAARARLYGPLGGGGARVAAARRAAATNDPAALQELLAADRRAGHAHAAEVDRVRAAAANDAHR